MLARIRKAMEKRDEGFTLIELLVVIIIIGILAAIAIPVFLNQRKKGYDTQAKSDARNLATLEETYMTDYNKYVGAADMAAVKGALTDYRPSANVSAVKIDLVDATGTATEATGTVAYCIQTTSASGNTFVYNSALGGLQPGTSATCP
ncbi:MAG TPA: prepilin-type N-terminal cleavage/methylation domain-containing protein [Acidothermaceae bacterium]